MKTFELKTEYEVYKGCVLEKAHYQYDSRQVYLGITSADEGPIATITVCLDTDIDLPEDSAFIDVNNCPWAPTFLEENHLGEFTGEMEASGFCVYPLYKLYLKADEVVDLEAS